MGSGQQRRGLRSQTAFRTGVPLPRRRVLERDDDAAVVGTNGQGRKVRRRWARESMPCDAIKRHVALAVKLIARKQLELAAPVGT